MSKRCPPIFNVILFAVAVIFMLLNPIANMIPWLPEAIKTAVTVAIYALYDFFNAAVKYCKLWFPLSPNFGVTEK